MRSRTWTVATLLFCSGFCALAYQIGWLREFRLIFGASTAASAAVLAIFIGGLGLGGWLLGPRVDRHPRPLLFYAQLEIVVAVSAAISPFLLSLVRAAYFASGGTATLGLFVGTMGRLVLSALVLAVPTVAMGGTLPAAARAATRDSDTRRQDLAALYALNTLGAVAGCTIATFALLEIYGTRTTLWLAALVNLLVAMTARALDRKWHAEPGGKAGEAGTAEEAAAMSGLAVSGGSGEPFPTPPALPALPALPAPAAPPAFVLAASGIVGFAFFLMELVWYRMLAPLLGGSVFTFGLILAVALVGIGLGGLIYALVSSDKPATLSGFAASCLLEALAVAGTFALGDRAAVFALLVSPLRAAGFAASVGGWSMVAGLVVLPPALVAGYQFPLLIALLGRGRDRLGRQIGLAYATNTIGAIVGSLVGGFGLLPWLTATGAWRLVAVVLLLLGAAAALLAARSLGSRRLIPYAVGAAAALLLIASTGPTAAWRHSGIGAGRVPMDVLGSANRLRAWQRAIRQWVRWDGDGIESTIALSVDPSGYAFVVNGKSDGNARGDAATQVMLGLVGALRHPNPRKVLLVGLGTGSSGGWLAAVPSVERVDVVELEPLVLRVAQDCLAVNHGALSNPKLRVIIGDARETLLTSRERYDVIVSEPSNPFRAGIASLFTQEFYQAANARLTEEGVVAQWVQGYEIDAPTLRTIYATMASVFPQVEAWQTHPDDILLLGSKRAGPYSARALAARIAEEPYRSALAHTWRATDINAFLGHYVAGDGVAREIAKARATEINTDDRNIVEFGLARSVGRARALMVPELRRLAKATGSARPPLSDEDGINWGAVDTSRVAYEAIQGSFGDVPTDAPPSERARQQALLSYFKSKDVDAAYTSWYQQTEGPRDLVEARMLADVEAEQGLESAMTWIERIRAYEPGEADVLVATLRWKQGRFDEAAAALRSAFIAFRTDPWITQNAMLKALTIAPRIALGAPSAAAGLYDALRQPFVVQAVNDERVTAAVEMSKNVDFAAHCREPLAPAEPHAPWTRYYLTLRRDCYEASKDPRLAIAERELVEFYAREAAPLAPPK